MLSTMFIGQPMTPITLAINILGTIAVLPFFILASAADIGKSGWVLVSVQVCMVLLAIWL
jgi:hypothetical protein